MLIVFLLLVFGSYAKTTRSDSLKNQTYRQLLGTYLVSRTGKPLVQNRDNQQSQ